MPLSEPRRLTLYFTRSTAFLQSFGFNDRAPDIATLGAAFTVRRRDSLNSPVLLTLAPAWTLDANRPGVLVGTFRATNDQTAAMPAGRLYWSLDLIETNGDRIRFLEGDFRAND